MTLNCLVTIATPTGTGWVEVRVSSLHQLAVVMPANVVSYEVRDKGEIASAPINDAELFDLLVGAVEDIERAG